MTAPRDDAARLRNVLGGIGKIAVAVSGGVDSLTLAAAAHETLGAAATMHHAVSPAVPEAATRRTIVLAAERGWDLDVFDAGEFAKDTYRANPVDRCFFCKGSLYAAMARRTSATLVSGTNLDDLGEYRPGLRAATLHGVRHPFVEAGIDKAAVRGLAALAGLGDIASLPASPCLSSRIETGLRIEADMLDMIDAVERDLRVLLRPQTVRCRLRHNGIEIELDAVTLAGLDARQAARVRQRVAEVAGPAAWHRSVSLAPYRNGSAFVHGAP